MSAPTPAVQRAESAAALRRLLATYESGDFDAFDRGYSELARQQGDALFGRIARLTRELHQAMAEVPLDDRLKRLAGEEIPDARSRLTHVITLTEKAAHRTLDLVDEARAITTTIEEQTRQLAQAQDPGAVAATLDTQVAALRRTLSDLDMAQEYQDLSGQMIKRVITLVVNVESALLDLLRGTPRPTTPLAERDPPNGAGSSLSGPALPGEAAANQQDADELLAGLGF